MDNLSVADAMGAVARVAGAQAAEPIREQARQGALYQDAKLLH